MVSKSEIGASAARLRRRLEVLQDHQRSVWFGEVMGLLGAVLVAALGGVMVLDNLVHLHVVLRVAALAGLVGATVLLVRRLGRLLREPLTAERMAVKVEAKFPQIDNRVINSLLLAKEDDAEASELIHSVIEEGNSDAAKLDVRSAIPKRRLAALGGSAVLAVALMGVYAGVYPNHFTNALVRVLFPFGGVRPLTRTKILDVTPKSCHILAGDDLTIGVELDGKLPDAAKVVYEPEDDETQVAFMRPQEEPNRFRCLIADTAQSFTYHVAAGDAVSDDYRVTVHHRPVVSELTVHVEPPGYAGQPAATQNSGTVRALQGASVTVRAACSKPIAKATLDVSTDGEQAMTIEGETTVVGSFAVSREGTYRILLTDTFDFEGKPRDHRIEVLADESPAIQLASPPTTVVVKPGGTIPFEFTVTDDYGVQGAELVQVVKDADGQDQDLALQSWTSERKDEKTLAGRYPLAVDRLRIPEGQSAVLQVVARDWNDVTGPGVTRSPRILVTLMSTGLARDERRDALKKAAEALAQIIVKQQRNLALGRALRSGEIRQPGRLGRDPEKLGESIRLQEEIRTASGQVVALMDPTLPMRGVLQLLYENEMVTAVQQLRRVGEAPKPVEALAAALQTESTILARLTGRGDQLQRTLETAALRDLFAALEELVREQKKIRGETEAAGQTASAGAATPLANRQDKLASKAVAFQEQLAEHAHTVAASDAEQAKRFDQAAQMVESRKIRSNMLLSASKLQAAQFSPALPIQDQILADLKAIGDFLREPVVASASQKLKDLQHLIQESKEKADRLAKLQAAVKEVSEELERSKDNTSDASKELVQHAVEQQDVREKIEDAVEKMAKDLSLFPEVPSCNELVQQMREVFEDVEQQPGSENQPADEIAVDRDEGLLEGLDKVKERLADMERWLMDKPDTTKWKQEGWDKEEMPEIPLVDLPEELEDLVGDLVDKEEDVDEEAQDSSSNASTADIPAGWDVADGPINNWSAKGASGNERPNKNEMAGRAGSGREGNANGEIVEGKAKDLEGRETEVRRTKDPFSEGYVEEENPESNIQKARATGGGKMSGTGGEGGLRGSAPARNELGMRDLERRQRELRRNTENIYSKACLMYLPTGELDKAVLLMHKAEEQARAGDAAGFSETQRRIVHALRNTQRSLAGERTVELDPRQKLPMALKEEMFDARDEPIPPEFEKLVAEYYKAIAAGVVK